MLVVLTIGAALLIVAIVMRRSRMPPVLAHLMLFLAGLWNAAIVFVFMSPHNRHVFHMATHRSSVVVNAAIGLMWLAACVFCAWKWYRRTAGASERVSE